MKVPTFSGGLPSAILLQGSWGYPYRRFAWSLAAAHGVQSEDVVLWTKPYRSDLERVIGAAAKASSRLRVFGGPLDGANEAVVGSLLKPVEEPPLNVAWVLWGPQEVPTALRSRCLVLSCEPLSVREVASELPLAANEAVRVAQRAACDLGYAQSIAAGESVRSQVVTSMRAIAKGDTAEATTIASALRYRGRGSSFEEVADRLSKFRTELLRLCYEVESGIERGFTDLDSARITVPPATTLWMRRVLATPASDDVIVPHVLVGAAQRVASSRAQRVRTP